MHDRTTLGVAVFGSRPGFCLFFTHTAPFMSRDCNPTAPQEGCRFITPFIVTFFHAKKKLVAQSFKPWSKKKKKPDATPTEIYHHYHQSLPSQLLFGGDRSRETVVASYSLPTTTTPPPINNSNTTQSSLN